MFFVEKKLIFCFNKLVMIVNHFFFRKKAVAKFLINAGADVLIPAKNGCTAFDMASLIGRLLDFLF